MFHGASPVALIALGSWVVTAALGANLLLRGQAYRLFRYAAAGSSPIGQQPPRVRATMMGLHFAGALSGLILWVCYLMFDRQVFAYGSLIALATVALLGLGVVDRWRNGNGRHARPVHPERSFPVWSATVHVMTATTTLVLVALIALLHIGS